MTQYVDPVSPTFLRDLNASVEGFEKQNRSFLLVHTPGKGFSLEGKDEYSWLSRCFSSSVYDSEKNLIALGHALSEKVRVPSVGVQELRQGALLAQKMQKLAAHIYQVKASSQHGNLALHYEAQCSRYIEQAAASSKRPPALIAAELGLFQIAIRCLASASQNPPLKPLRRFFDQLLSAALESNEWKIAIQLVDAGASLECAKRRGVLNLLLYAAVELNNEAVTLQILQMGSQIEALVGRTPLLHAAIKQNFAIPTIRALLQAGCEVNGAARFTESIFGITISAVEYSPLAFAVDQRRYDVVALLLDSKAQANGVHPVSNTPLAQCVLEAGEEDLTIQFIENGFPLDYQDPQHGQTLLHMAAAKGLQKVILYLIRKGLDVSSQNSRGETAAFGASFDVIQLLLANGLDPSLTDTDRYTFLSKQNSTTIARFLHVRGFVLPHGNATDIVNNPDVLLQMSPDNNPLEICFFFQQTQLTKAVASKMTQDQFESALWKLRAKYPDFSTGSIALAPYEVDLTHLKTAFDLSKIPPKPTDVDYKDLLMVFDSIDFTNKFKPGDYSPDLKDLTYQEFRKLISERVIGRIKNRVADAASGQEGTTYYILFFDKLQSALLHLTKKLKTLGNDPESLRTKASFFFELAIATPVCLEPVSQAICNWYNFLLRNIPTTFKNYLLSSLTAAREDILRSLIPHEDRGAYQGRNQQENHDLHQLKYLVGKDFGIEGADFFSAPDQVRARRYPEKEPVLKQVMERYTAPEIVELVAPQITDFQTWRGKAKEEFKLNIPPTWRKEFYDDLKKTIHTMRLTKPEADIKKYLQDKDVYYQNMTAEEAIEDHRAYEYYTNEVLVDPEKFDMQKPALARLLHTFGVLQTVFTDKGKPTGARALVNSAHQYLRSWLPW